MQGRRLHQADLVRGHLRTQRGAAVARRHQEQLGPGVGRGHDLLLDAADRADLAAGVDGAGAGDVVPAGQRAGGEGVVDRGREDQPGAGTADRLVDAHLHVEREVVTRADLDADDRALLVALRRLGGHLHRA